MPIPTNQAEQYKRLRSYLNPYIKGPNTDAVLNALASANAAYLINNVSAVNDQLYIVSASGQYLDARLSQWGISRPAAVGLADEVFSQIGIAIKNRKQVRDLINELLDAIFGDEYVRASNPASMVEPYNLNDGDTLIFNLDDRNTVTVTFSAAQFSNIHAALAIEVADAIASSLSSQGIAGEAIAKNDGNGNYVELLSNTIGPASSVTVLGGSAQNKLVFPTPVAAGGNSTTQWTITLRSGGLVRFTWTGGADPQLGKVSAGNYVNIFGGGFTGSPNQGSFTIETSVGGVSGASYFEIQNPLGVAGTVTEGVNSAVLFYNPIRRTLLSLHSYAAVFQVSSRTLHIFLPATTKVIRRSRVGSAHIHSPANISFILNSQPNPGDVFQITSTVSLTAGSSFTIGANTSQTAANMAAALASTAGITAVAGVSVQTDGDIGSSMLTVWQDDFTLTLVGSYTGSASIVASGPQGDPNSSKPNQQGPYSYDTTQSFTVSFINTTLTQELDGTKARIFDVANAANFPDSSGFLIFGYGTQNQEGPVPYISRPSSNTLLLSPVYTLQNTFQPGTTVFLVAQNSPPIPTPDGLNFPFYVTDVVSGREYAQNTIQSITATGITVIFTILYPNDIGLGKWGTPFSEISTVYGP